MRSILLLMFFPILLLCLAYALLLLWIGFTSNHGISEGLSFALETIPTMAPITLAVSGAWFCVAFFSHQALIDMATKARSLSINEEPRAYRLLENLSISRGETMPKLKVIETPVLNAYASGIREKNYTVTLTRGLLNTLDDEELEAVIAHELSHIRNKDVRMMIIAVIFVGIFAFVGESVVRGVFRTNLPRSSNHRRSGGGNAGALILFALAIIAVTYLIAILIRFSLSRKREFLADAGAIELTKNPDAMIRVLQKLSGNAELRNVPDEIREMALHNPRVGLAGAFATHPPIEKRIEAIVKFAGGHIGTKSRPTPSNAENFSRSALKREKSSQKVTNPWKRNP
ncbi:heat shock protein [Litorimonas taeanensis]|uniref:Heat shock protein n=1 Tax=Litorimonas taeanensis TaxID=568099 RepID=A0A420WKB6_9PROT|nr:M48 family metallopeptidase [Litorimonas taeanensis]RKQ71444.1 heat shock protein [Litorimonas taeanensis]